MPGFVIHPSFVRSTSLAGAPAHESLFKSMGILAFNHAGKLASGELLHQHVQLSAVFWRANLYHKNMQCAAGAVVMRSAITLILYHSNYDTYFANVAWGEEGGAARLREHFAEWAVARLLQALLDAMDLRLCEDPVECLGGGVGFQGARAGRDGGRGGHGAQGGGLSGLRPAWEGGRRERCTVR
jgi:hypothetical protein